MHIGYTCLPNTSETKAVSGSGVIHSGTIWVDGEVLDIFFTVRMPKSDCHIIVYHLYGDKLPPKPHKKPLKPCWQDLINSTKCVREQINHI